MALQNLKQNMWTDHKGAQVPRAYVPKPDQAKELKIGKIFNHANALSAKLKAFKDEAYSICDELYAETLRAANITPTDRKGNYSISSFDKTIKIEVNVADRIDFDDNITLAQEKLNEFIRLKTAGADMELSALVNQAFTTRKGRLDKARIFGLMQLNIAHPIWGEAMDLIRKSITTNSSVRYMEIAQKDPDGRYIPVILNFATL
jgi:hypothetical protein